MTMPLLWSVLTLTVGVVPARSTQIPTVTFGKLGEAGVVAAPRAATFVEHGQGPDESSGTVGAELLRFVTAYKTGLEALVDITPHAPLLEAAADQHGFVNFYAFIDTWVNNASGFEIYLKKSTGQCFLVNHTDGNGWALTAELLLWDGEKRVDSRPREVVKLASGFFGGHFPFGDVEIHEGTVTRDQAVELLTPIVGELSSFAAPPPVYICPDGQEEALRSALLGHAATEALRFERVASRSRASDARKREARENLRRSLVEMFISGHLVPIDAIGPGNELFDSHFGSASNMTYTTNLSKDSTISNISNALPHDPTASTFTAIFHAKHVQAEPGMPVYYESPVFTQHFDRRTKRRYTEGLPFEAVGVVTHVVRDLMVVRMNHKCVPSAETNWLPRFRMPTGPSIVPEAEALVESAFRRGSEVVSVARTRSSDNPSEVAKDAQDMESVDGYGRHLPHQSEFLEPLLLRPISGWTRWKAATQLPQDTVTLADAAEDHVLGVPTLVGRLRARHRPASETPSAEPGSSLELGVQPSLSLELSSLVDTRVCVVTQRLHGRIFSRTFEVGSLFSGEKVLLHLTVTGHGWAATSEQCGEYCHAVYQLAINGKSAANVSEFRDDCPKNPIKRQYGTWTEHRNGWCPGTVEHGVYFDVTNWAKTGTNTLDFGAVVWSEERQRYEPYTNFAGLVFHDQASLTVDLSVLVYASETVDLVLAQGRPYTQAEKALFYGTSSPEALLSGGMKPPRVSDSLLQPPQFDRRGRARRSTPGGLVEAPEAAARPGERLASFLQGARPKLVRSEDRQQWEVPPPSEQVSTDPFDFTRRAPWFLYSSASEGDPAETMGARRVPVFSKVLMQSDTRTVQVSVPMSLLWNWTQAALHFALSEPAGLKFDNWDRQGSFGLVLQPGAQEASVHVTAAPVENHQVPVVLPRHPPEDAVPPPLPM